MIQPSYGTCFPRRGACRRVGGPPNLAPRRTVPIVVGRDGRLYMPSVSSNRLVPYHGTTGILINALIRSHIGPRDAQLLRLRPNGDYDGTGSLLGALLTYAHGSQMRSLHRPHSRW